MHFEIVWGCFLGFFCLAVFFTVIILFQSKVYMQYLSDSGGPQCLFLAGQGCEGGKARRTKLSMSLCVCRIHMLLDLDIRV